MIEKPQQVCGNCPLYRGPMGRTGGFSLPEGEMLGGVAVVGESLTKDEEGAGRPFTGKTGQTFFQQLKRIGIQRDQFRLLNTISCAPPNNKFRGMPYENEATLSCSPLLDGYLETARCDAKGMGKTFVIVALGITAFKRILGLSKDDPILKEDSFGYPFWSDTYKAWVLHSPHPKDLVRGKTELWPVLHFVFSRALEIAKDGITLINHDYLLDPTPWHFGEWAGGYLISLKDRPDNPLSYDIETPYKKKKGEDTLEDDDDSDHTILRTSFAYEKPDGTISCTSVKWSAEYMSVIELLFEQAPVVLGWNNQRYDNPKVSHFTPIKGKSIDAMVAWHILNTSLPKGLGFVTPYYIQNMGMWKHLSDAQPSLYNAIDSVAALKNYIGIKADLIKNGLWHVFENHVLRLDVALSYMSQTGVLMDTTMRKESEDKLSLILDEVEAKMEATIPDEARTFKIYKNKPKGDIEGLIEVEKIFPVKYCGVCGLLKPTKTHSKHCPNWKVTLLDEPKVVWAKPLEFKLSMKGLSNYQQALKHQAVTDWKSKKVTFNEDAIVKLMKAYPKDPLYPNIIEFRHISKLLSTYIGITQYDTVKVEDDYVLKEGESWEV